MCSSDLCRARPAAHNGKVGPLAQTPTAMQGPQGLHLALQRATGGILAGVVVAEDAGHRQGQLAQHGGNALLTIAEVANHQQGIRLEGVQQGMVTVVPGAMQIPSDGDA